LGKVGLALASGEVLAGQDAFLSRTVKPIMPVFYFDILDDQGFALDADGCEFGCVDEARDEAVRFLPDLARTLSPFGGRCDLAVKVRDEKGSYSYAVTLSLGVERLLQTPTPDRAAKTDRPKSKKSVPDTPAELHQVVVHPLIAADAAVSRIASRLSTQHFLRSAEMVREHTGGDLVTGVVLRVITAGNIGYLDQDPDTFGRFASLEDAPPDDVRRPVSISAVAGSLGLTYETARRHVSKLVKAGLCVRVKGGVIAPSAKVRGPWEHQAMLANMASLRRLYRALKRAGAKLD
jgi:hypothetical protein